MSEHKAPYLHLVRSVETSSEPLSHVSEASVQPEISATRSAGAQGVETLDGGIEASAAAASQPAPSRRADTAENVASSEASNAQAMEVPLNQPITQAIMYAAVGWVALCVERAVYAVDITPIARRTYEVSARYADASGAADAGEGIILRVTLEVASGLVVHSTVEPVRP